MKRKNIYYIISAVVLLIGASLFYFLYDHDENRISPVVSIPSYEDRLMHEILSRTGKAYDQLTTDEKIQVLKDISKIGMEVPRIAAVRKLGDFAGNILADAAMIDVLNDSTASVIEEAIHVIKNKRINSADAALREKVLSLHRRADAAIPISDVEYATLIGSTKNGDVVFDVREYPQRLAPMNDNLVSEINLFLPQGAFYYLSFPNFDNTWRSFTKTDFVKGFVEQPAYHDLDAFPPLEDFYHFKKIADEKLGGLSSYFTPDKLFRDDLKFARYPEGKLFVTFKGKNVEIARSLLGVFKTLGGDKYSYSESEYHGAKIVHILYGRSKKTISFATAGDYFILSDSPALLDKSLRTFYEERDLSITALPSFQQSYKTLDLTGKTQFLYAFFEPTSVLKLKGENRHSKYLIKIALDALSTLRGSLVTLDQIVGSGNTKNTSSLLKCIPKEIISFHVFDKFNPKDFWKYFTQVRTISPTALDSLQRITGLNIENDLISHLNEGAFISYSGIRYGADHESNISAMQFIVGLNSIDASSLVKPLNKVFDFLFRYPLAKEDYNGTVIYASQQQDGMKSESEDMKVDTITTRSLKDIPISPAFTVLDNNILLGMNVSVLKEHIDAYKGRKESYFSTGLLQDPVEQKFILNSQPFLKNFYSFLSRYARRTTRFTDAEIDARVKPLFKLLELNQSMHGWFKELNTIFHGQITIDMK